MDFSFASSSHPIASVQTLNNNTNKSDILSNKTILFHNTNPFGKKIFTNNELSNRNKIRNFSHVITTSSTTTRNNNNNNNQYPIGLRVTAKQISYPIELSNSELLSHFETIQEYQYDIESNIIQGNSSCNPSLRLINQQPEINPYSIRPLVTEFTYKLAKLTRVTTGIYFQAIRLFDRYCSKRIVLREQIHLILGTCLWLTAKTYGGCSHVINNVVIPPGGRFYGPNPRARVPRLNELVYYCQQASSSLPLENPISLDESMFLQMEKHILDTLDWNVLEPTLNDYVFNVDECCLIQYESYQKRSSVPNEDELNEKIQLIYLKKFLMDLVTWNLDFLDFELFEITDSLFHIINRFANGTAQSSLLDFPLLSQNKQVTLFNIFINSINNVPDLLYNTYKDRPGILQFINNVKLFYIQSRQPSLSTTKASLNTSSIASTSSPQYIPSPVYSTHSSTPLKNVVRMSENSIFSSLHNTTKQSMQGTNSPLTPLIYHKAIDLSSGNNSSLSLGKRPYQEGHLDETEDMVVPPKSNFLNTEISAEESDKSSRTSLISLTVGQ